jgi:hypothetical protein
MVLVLDVDVNIIQKNCHGWQLQALVFPRHSSPVNAVDRCDTKPINLAVPPLKENASNLDFDATVVQKLGF